MRCIRAIVYEERQRGSRITRSLEPLTRRCEFAFTMSRQCGREARARGRFQRVVSERNKKPQTRET